MVSMAIFHETVPAYVKQDNKHFDVVCGTTDEQQFEQNIQQHSPQVLLLDLGLLGPHPVERVRELEKKAMPETTIIIYSFAKRSVIEELRAEHRQVLRGPLKMQDLRTALVNLIVRDMTTRPRKASQPVVPDTPPPADIFKQEELARLQEIQSAVDCECPNHVSDVIIALKGFEEYSKQCENKDDADARMHEFLWRAAGHSRALMEHAMKELCRFEGIDLKNPVPPSASSPTVQ
jgi:DNA-binding NarL/FixJ family response regulator